MLLTLPAGRAKSSEQVPSRRLIGTSCDVIMSASTVVEAAAAAARAKKLNLDKATNFMRQYRDPQSRELKKLSANQFMEVWSHYDKDGESNSSSLPSRCMWNKPNQKFKTS